MRRRSRGFSLLELVVVVAIISLLAAVVIPSFQAAKRRSEMNEVVRAMEANLTRARSLAAKGQSTNVSGTWAASDKTVSAGIRIISTTQYAVFVDRNTITNGDEVDVTIVDILRNHPGSTVRITAPAPASEVRFRANGLLTNAVTPVDIVITRDTNVQSKTVRVGSSGIPKIL